MVPAVAVIPAVAVLDGVVRSLVTGFRRIVRRLPLSLRRVTGRRGRVVRRVVRCLALTVRDQMREGIFTRGPADS